MSYTVDWLQKRHDKSFDMWQNTYTMLLEILKSEAIQRGHLKSEDEIDIKRAFFLVRDMPYTRASSRDSETIIHEWRGTCSGNLLGETLPSEKAVC